MSYRSLDSAATPLGNLAPAEATLIDAENLFRQPGPPLYPRSRLSHHPTNPKLNGSPRHEVTV